MMDISEIVTVMAIIFGIGYIFIHRIRQLNMEIRRLRHVIREFELNQSLMLRHDD